MSPVTAPSHSDASRNFQEFVPLLPDRGEFLLRSFALSDSDPRWSFGPGADNALRLQRSLQTVAKGWNLPQESLMVLPDRYMAFYTAIVGSLESKQYSTVSFSPIDKKEILAIVAGLAPEISRREFAISSDGSFDCTGIAESLCIFQLRNGETGITQSQIPQNDLIIDATSALPGDLDSMASDSLWNAIILDATSWGGPRGVCFLAINPQSRWRNPFPTLDTRMPIFGANYGLTLLAALELEQSLTWDHEAIAAANREVREIVATIGDVDFAGSETRDRLSLSLLYLQSEELQRRLFEEGFLVDSGSACSSSDLEPSHVLTGMGLLSHGNVRIRFRPENLGQAHDFAMTLIKTATKMRSAP